MLNLEIESVPQHTLREEVDVVIVVVYITVSSLVVLITAVRYAEI